MSGSGLVVAASIAAVVAVWLLASGTGRLTPSLASAIRSIRRDPEPREDPATSAASIDRLGAAVRSAASIEVSSSSRSALRVIGRRVDQQIGMLAVSSLSAMVAPSALLLLIRSFGGTGGVLGGVVLPAGVGLVAAVVVPALVHSATIERAAETRIDLRHQLSGYVDMVTMLLAGNTGHEGALVQAADAGDGQLFRELRRRIREVSTTGRSAIDALDLVAADLDLDELAQIAATGRLAATEGAPVARTLAAKCATLRSTLATDQEAQARVRTDKVTPPLVAMTVLFMAVIIYPALNL